MIRKIKSSKNNKILLKIYNKIMEMYKLESSHFLKKQKKEVKSKRLCYAQSRNYNLSSAKDLPQKP